MDSKELDELAGRLDQAILGAYEVERLTLTHPELSLADSYRVQELGIQRRQKRGETPLGYKMGFTSQAKREQMKLHSPIAGVLTDKMEWKDGATVALTSLIHPKIEPELAFKIGKTLSGEPSLDEVRDAIDTFCPALEILDSRYKGFKYFSLPDVVADNCSSSHFVMSSKRFSFKELGQDFDLSALSMEMIINGQVVQKAQSNAISGNPLISIAQLCEILSHRGQCLEKGAIVLAGAATQAEPFLPHAEVELRVDRLGCVRVRGGSSP